MTDSYFALGVEVGEAAWALTFSGPVGKRVLFGVGVGLAAFRSEELLFDDLTVVAFSVLGVGVGEAALRLRPVTKYMDFSEFFGVGDGFVLSTSSRPSTFVSLEGFGFGVGVGEGFTGSFALLLGTASNSSPHSNGTIKRIPGMFIRPA